MNEPINIDDIRWHEYEFKQSQYPRATEIAYETLLPRGRRGYVFWKPTGYWWSFFSEYEDGDCLSIKPFSQPDDAKANFAAFYEEFRGKTPEQIKAEIEQSIREFERQHSAPAPTPALGTATRGGTTT